MNDSDADYLHSGSAPGISQRLKHLFQDIRYPLGIRRPYDQSNLFVLETVTNLQSIIHLFCTPVTSGRVT